MVWHVCVGAYRMPLAKNNKYCCKLVDRHVVGVFCISQNIQHSRAHVSWISTFYDPKCRAESAFPAHTKSGQGVCVCSVATEPIIVTVTSCQSSRSRSKIVRSLILSYEFDFDWPRGRGVNLIWPNKFFGELHSSRSGAHCAANGYGLRSRAKVNANMRTKKKKSIC